MAERLAMFDELFNFAGNELIAALTYVGGE